MEHSAFTPDLARPVSSEQVFSLFDLMREIAAAKDFASLFDQGAEAFSILGGNSFSCGVLENDTRSIVGFSSTMSANWLQHYSDRNYKTHDPLMQHFRSSEDPLFIGWGQDHVQHPAPIARTISQEAAEAGYPHAMFVPVAIKGAYSVGVTVTSDLSGRDSADFLAERGTSIVLAANLFAMRAAHLFRPADTGRFWLSSAQQRLSPRETEVLSWLAGGLRPDRIADQLGIATVTVQMHLRSARDKLGARTPEQAIARAAFLRLI